MPWTTVEKWLNPLVIAILVALFYAVPLLSVNASIHWDAANVTAPLQKYFADRVIGRQLPFWTPYLFSGYPLLANPEVGAWYPPNWPFFLIRGLQGVQGELMLNALLACMGAYLFFRETVTRSTGAVVGALAYGLSGFFAGHSSHVTIFQAAACFPWLLWAYRRAVDGSAARGIAAGALAGGCMILAGSLPAAFFGFAGLACYAAVSTLLDARRRVRSLAVAGAILLLSLGAASVQLLPAAELIQRSSLSPADASLALQPRALLTLLLPDAAGTISMTDKGMVTNHYLYAGLLLLPLVFFGAFSRRILWPALALIVPAFWYALGPSAGFSRLAGFVPYLQSLSSPDLAWFLCAFGLAWLAAAGHYRVFQFRSRLGFLILALLFADLWYWNLYRNPLAFAHRPYDALYSETVGRNIAARQIGISRFDSPGPLSGAGPLLFPLDLKFETTSGYLSLQPALYAEYASAIPTNPRLRDGLNVQRYLDASSGAIEMNNSILPRVYFPRSAVGVAGEAESRAALRTLDPTAQSTVLVPDYGLQQDPAADLYILRADEQSYLVHYRSRAPSLLKLSVPWYPGWTASLSGQELPVVRVDHALMGVVVPPGDGRVEFQFHSRYFATGVIASLAALVLMVWLVLGDALWKRLTMKAV
ncbi:MAG TPA: YfhO family protein [Candidatus Sulfopaludibacter sp.]|nr:YfhO family protein [Candidatus Sulfopaludibacter sp.]